MIHYYTLISISGNFLTKFFAFFAVKKVEFRQNCHYFENGLSFYKPDWLIELVGSDVMLLYFTIFFSGG